MTITEKEFYDAVRKVLDVPTTTSTGEPPWPTDDEMKPLVRRGTRTTVALVSPRAVLTQREEHRCVQCKHLFVNHVYVAVVFRGRQPLGGHAFCPCKRCPCYRSWAVHDDAGFDVRERITDMTRDEAVALGVPLRT